MQGLGGAAVSAVALALIMGLFSGPGERAKAMGVFGLRRTSGGGAVGVLLGGVLTGLFSWHWTFLVNVADRDRGASFAAAGRSCPATTSSPAPARLDVPGAVLVTGALTLVGLTASSAATRRAGPPAARSAILAVSALVFVMFVAWEATGRRSRSCRCGCSGCAP